MPNYTELRQQVDELAVRLVLSENDGQRGAESWMQSLEAIQNAAVREGATEAAEVASAVLSTMRSSENPAVLQEGLARLASVLEKPAEPASSQPATDSSLAQDPELLSDFILESREHLASLETQPLVLERDPSNSEALHSIFRSFHTIKGLAGFLELWKVQKMAHEVETVLDQARNLRFQVTPEAIDVILESAEPQALARSRPIHAARPVFLRTRIRSQAAGACGGDSVTFTDTRAAGLRDSSRGGE